MSREAGQFKIKSQANLASCKDLVWFINADFFVYPHMLEWARAFSHASFVRSLILSVRFYPCNFMTCYISQTLHLYGKIFKRKKCM